MLHIQTLLELHGLQATVDYLKLECKVKDNLVLLKYRQLDADWTKPATLECRGIILERGTWKVVAYPYDKFFNLGEGYAAKMDWESTVWYTKLDGSLMNLYYYKGEWRVQTSGTIDADTGSNHISMTFADLFWKAVTDMYGCRTKFLLLLDTNKNYMFELCTPWNIVVTPHTDYKVYLHGVRDMKTFKWIELESVKGLVTAERHNISSITEMESTLNDMPWQDEGYVLVDKYFNRVKCKNPKYVAVHHTATKVSPYAIMSVIKSNEIDEFLAYFAHHTDEVMLLKSKWDELHNDLLNYYNTVKDIETDKEFALTVKECELKRYSGLFFSLRNGRIKSVHEGMCKISDRELYNKFLNNK